MAKETMLTWSRKAKALEEIPVFYRETYNKFTSGTVPFTIIAPPRYSGRIKKSLPQLLFLWKDTLFILEKHKNEIKSFQYELNKINYIERGVLLLSSWIKVNGITGNTLFSHRTDFNTVTEKFFIQIIDEVRLANNEFRNDVIIDSEKSKFYKLLYKNFKFMNYGIDSLMGGEKVIDMLLQPEMNIGNRKYFRKYIPAHILILTDKELILIKDNMSLRTDNVYGGIWTYIPLNKIKLISVDDNPKNATIMVSIAFKTENIITLSFEVSKRKEIDDIINQLLELNIQTERFFEKK